MNAVQHRTKFSKPVHFSKASALVPNNRDFEISRAESPMYSSIREFGNPFTACSPRPRAVRAPPNTSSVSSPSEWSSASAPSALHEPPVSSRVSPTSVSSSATAPSVGSAVCPLKNAS